MSGIWPKQYTSAVMFSFDVDGDTTWENGNRGMPNGEQYLRSLSIGQYGPNRCVDRILELLAQYSVKGSFYVPGLTAERYPQLIQRIFAQGHEIGHHGYAHERFADKPVAEQIAIIEKSQAIFQELLGCQAKGFRTPSGDWSKETPQLLWERGFVYSSSMRGDDRPYWTEIDGVETDFLEIPTKWELDDYVAMAYCMYPAEPGGLDRISCYRTVLDNFRREFAGGCRFGLCTSFMFHPQVIGTPGRLFILEQLLKEAVGRSDVWVATGLEIAEWFRTGQYEEVTA